VGALAGRRFWLGLVVRHHARQVIEVVLLQQQSTIWTEQGMYWLPGRLGRLHLMQRLKVNRRGIHLQIEWFGV
jgi:hypothetical protein